MRVTRRGCRARCRRPTGVAERPRSDKAPVSLPRYPTDERAPISETWSRNRTVSACRDDRTHGRTSAKKSTERLRVRRLFWSTAVPGGVSRGRCGTGTDWPDQEESGRIRATRIKCTQAVVASPLPLRRRPSATAPTIAEPNSQAAGGIGTWLIGV